MKMFTVVWSAAEKAENLDVQLWWNTPVMLTGQVAFGHKNKDYRKLIFPVRQNTSLVFSGHITDHSQ